jgi:putative hydrolase of the HAD superfamily
MSAAPELVLFDLGGVLIELTGVSTMAAMARIDDEQELWHRWLSCPWVRTFESGNCSPDEFAGGVIDDWGLAVGRQEFLELFTSWPVGPLAGAEDLVEATASRVSVGCLTNTNELHWDDNVEHWSLIRRFDHRFASHRMGQVKPDPEMFAQVAEGLPVPKGRVLLLDDNRANVDGARAAGFRAEQVDGVAAARRVLTTAGVL